PGARPAGVRCERARPRRKARYKWGMMDTPEPHPRHPATMAEVARAARVSRATVSRLLSGAVEVSPETRSRVRGAVDQLGYVPSIGAQQLAAGRSQSIGLLIRDSRNPVYALLQSQAQKWADEFGLHVVTAMPTFYRGAHQERSEEHTSELQSRFDF